jgi:hypothetical protein
MHMSRTIVSSLLVITGITGIAVIAAAQRQEPEPPDIAGDPYTVALEVTETGGQTTWKYTINKAGPRSKDLGHFVLDFGNCGDESPTIGSIVAVTVNGEDWSDRIESSEGGGTGCGIASSNIVKFDKLPKAATHVIEFTLDDVYPPMDSSGWLKAGQMCVRTPLLAPGCKGYRRTTTMNADPSIVGQPFGAINTYMRQFGFDFTEHPNCTGGFGGHIDGVHGAVDLDDTLMRHVFRFDIHIDPVIDGDRCSSSTVDRQRNEMKSITNNSTWAKVQGNWDEWQILEWKFKIPAGLQPTQNFFHIHQLKAQDGPNNGAPTITITPRSTSSGVNKRIQIIHSVDGAPTGKGTIVDNVPLSAFEGEWVQVRETMRYTHDGYYAIKITRIRDGAVLIDFTDPNIDMWRIGSSYIRSKFGLYRSLAGGRLDQNPVGQSPLLKNESIWISDFRVYEKNTNPNPGVPHD